MALLVAGLTTANVSFPMGSLVCRNGARGALRPLLQATARPWMEDAPLLAAAWVRRGRRMGSSCGGAAPTPPRVWRPVARDIVP